MEEQQPIGAHFSPSMNELKRLDKKLMAEWKMLNTKPPTFNLVKYMIMIDENHKTRMMHIRNGYKPIT